MYYIEDCAIRFYRKWVEDSIVMREVWFKVVNPHYFTAIQQGSSCFQSFLYATDLQEVMESKSILKIQIDGYKLYASIDEVRQSQGMVWAEN